MFYSTRNRKLRYTASQAIMQGLSQDGGLFLPCEIKAYPMEERKLALSYQELAKEILSLYLDDFTPEEISSCVEKAYGKNNFEEKIISLHHGENHSFLELFNGPTITFKDMALSLLPHLMDVSIRKQGITKKVMILTATSGDTGSAALNGFSKADNILINVFYPEGGISPIQEKQMLSFTNSTARAYSLTHSNFDDCQRIVKETLSKGNKDYVLTSANSINIGRLLPQIVYYYKAYLDLVNEKKISLGEEIEVYVPTGNFGNIFAAYLAKEMGLPVSHLVCASNENRILTDFFETGSYSLKRDFKLTNSPSMDILISSNFERILSLKSESEEELKSYMFDLKEKKGFQVSEKLLNSMNDFRAFSCDQKETLAGMKSYFETNHYMMDPHTAVAYGAYRKNPDHSHYALIVSTASPYKFSKAVLDTFNTEEKDDFLALEKVATLTGTKIPSQLVKLIHHDNQIRHVSQREIEGIIFKEKRFEITTPATSANLGIGFDVLGLALSLYNKMRFETAEKDELVNFEKEDTNLVLHSYQYLFEKLNKKYQPVKITLLENQIPISRGLGSSASCIISGLLAANKMMNEILDDSHLLQYAIELEGHPDNVVPCLYGGIKASLKVNGVYQFHDLSIHPDYQFYLGISQQRLKTADARKVLPEHLTRNETVYDISHAMLLPEALKEKNLSLLKECVKDNIHTPYRLPLMNDALKIQDAIKDDDVAFMISGSGSTLLFIAENDSFLTKLQALHTGYEFCKAMPEQEGTKVEDIQ